MTQGPLSSTFNQIGKMKQYLCAIGLEADCKTHHVHHYDDQRDAATRVSSILAANAKDLHSLHLAHQHICSGTFFPALFVDVASFVQQAKPLVESLRASFETQSLALSVLDVVQIEVPLRSDGDS